MTYLIIDTETNGLPQAYHLPLTDLTNWPRLISVAWGLYNEEGQALSQAYALVKPDGYRWNPVAQRIHGISPAQAEAQGLPLVDVLNQLRPALVAADYWVGHNIDLDYGVIGAEFIRAGRAWPGQLGELPSRPLLCTMAASARVAPGGEPTNLAALYKLLTSRPMKGLHDATADMLATAHCFFELKRRNAFG